MYETHLGATRSGELLVFLLPAELGTKANKVNGVKNVPLSAIQTYTSEAYCFY